MKLAWGAKVTEMFRSSILDICRDYNWSGDHANWLMACIAFETATTFSPSIRNAAGSGATGLIQFMPRTAMGLGTTVEELAGMSAVQQLEYVRKYFKPYAKRIKTLSDMYMAIFAPIAIGKHEDHPLYSSGMAYRLNSPLDINNDGKITKGEATRFVSAKLEEGLAYGNWYGVPWNVTDAHAIINRIKADVERLEQWMDEPV